VRSLACETKIHPICTLVSVFIGAAERQPPSVSAISAHRAGQLNYAHLNRNRDCPFFPFVTHDITARARIISGYT
jgi:hypothetical protein